MEADVVESVLCMEADVVESVLCVEVNVVDMLRVCCVWKQMLLRC